MSLNRPRLPHPEPAWKLEDRAWRALEAPSIRTEADAIRALRKVKGLGSMDRALLARAWKEGGARLCDLEPAEVVALLKRAAPAIPSRRKKARKSRHTAPSFAWSAALAFAASGLSIWIGPMALLVSAGVLALVALSALKLPSRPSQFPAPMTVGLFDTPNGLLDLLYAIQEAEEAEAGFFRDAARWLLPRWSSGPLSPSERRLLSKIYQETLDEALQKAIVSALSKDSAARSS